MARRRQRYSWSWRHFYVVFILCAVLTLAVLFTIPQPNPVRPRAFIGSSAPVSSGQNSSRRTVISGPRNKTYTFIKTTNSALKIVRTSQSSGNGSLIRSPAAEDDDRTRTKLNLSESVTVKGESAEPPKQDTSENGERSKPSEQVISTNEESPELPKQVVSINEQFAEPPKQETPENGERSKPSEQVISANEEFAELPKQVVSINEEPPEPPPRQVASSNDEGNDPEPHMPGDSPRAYDQEDIGNGFAGKAEVVDDDEYYEDNGPPPYAGVPGRRHGYAGRYGGYQEDYLDYESYDQPMVTADIRSSGHADLVAAAYNRSVTAFHHHDFVGDLPLFPFDLCGEHNRSPGIATWGKFPYLEPALYLNTSKNPCWKEGEKILCVPYFVIVGISKSGTSDLYARILEHPEVSKSIKEKHFFDRERYNRRKPMTFRGYVDKFKKLATDVLSDLNSKGYSSRIAGDASPSYFFESQEWPLFSGNEGCTEPRVLLSHHIMHLNPHTRVIIIYRDPVERLYSRYLFNCGHTESCAESNDLSAVRFHAEATKGLAKYRACFRHHSLRHCVYDKELALSVHHALRIQESLYSVILEDWLRVVPRKQLLVIKFESYVTNTQHELQRVFSFLGLGPVPPETKRWMRHMRPQNRGKHYRAAGPMRRTTRRLLRTFFQPFYTRFEELLIEHDLLPPDAINERPPIGRPNR